MLVKRISVFFAFVLSFAAAIAQTAPPVSLGGSAGITGGQSREGMTSITVSGNYTLSPNEWWAGTLIINGSPSGAFNVVAPLNTGQQYKVLNLTSQTGTIIGATGSGVPVQPYSTSLGGMVVFSDATNYYSAGGGGSTSVSSLGLVIADGSTYATIQAAYTAACGSVPNKNVYVPATSTVTDTVGNTPNYMISTCTAQVTDDRSGTTFGSRGNNLFQATTPRKDYYPREGTLKSHWIDLINNGVSSAVTGLPTTAQWPVALHGDSVSGFATFYTLVERSFGLGVAGYFMSAAHTGTNNNEGFYGLGQGSINLTSLVSGTTAIASNGTSDPTTPNGSSLTLGSSSTTGTLTFYLMSAQQGSVTRYRNMQQASIFYLCDGKPATINVQSSPDGQNFYNETITSAQPNSCAATGGVVAVGVQGVGSGSGCGTLTLGATGGTGFVGTGVPNSSGAIDHVVVNSSGSGYNPYTSTITITGGSCSVNPTWGNILTSNISIQQATIAHDGIGIVKVTNSTDAVKILGFGLYNPTQSGIVFEDMGFGGTSYDSLFAAPDSYTAPWYSGMPVPDTIYTQYLDGTTVGGSPLNTWFQKDYDRTVTQHATKAATFGTQATCNAAGYGWDTQCRPYTPDVVWVSAYQSGNTATAGSGNDGDNAVMKQVGQINRTGGNAIYLDDSYSQINSQDSFRRSMFPYNDVTHMSFNGRALQNTITQQTGGIPPQDLYASKAFTAIHVGQGSVTAPGVSFVRTGGAGFIYNTAARQIMALGGLVSEGNLTSLAGTFATPTTYIPPASAGTTSASYMICAAGGNLNPVGCTPTVSVTTGPTTLSSTNYIQVCLPRPILGAGFYSLIRTAGYSGPIVVYNTQFFTNADTPPCMNDMGQAGSAYTASNWNPSGYLRINSPNTPVDFGQFMAVRSADTAYDIYLGQGSNTGQNGGFGVAVRSTANVNNFCRFSVAVSTSWAGALGCGGTYGNAQFNFLNPVLLNPGSTTVPNFDISQPGAFMTGTVPLFRIRANSSSGTCPSGGCVIFVTPDSAFTGYMALFSDSANVHKFGVKPSGLEILGNTNLATTSNGTGTNLLRSTGTLTSTHMAVFDANNNAIAEPNVTANGTDFFVSATGTVGISGNNLVTIGINGGNPAISMSAALGNMTLWAPNEIAISTANSATSGTNYPSTPFRYRSSFYNGTIAVPDDWTVQNVLGTGTTPTSTLTFSHTAGSPGTAIVGLPAGSTAGGSAICTPANGLCTGGGSGQDYWWNQGIGCTMGTTAGDTCTGSIQVPTNTLPDGNYFLQCTAYQVGGVIDVMPTPGPPWPTTAGASINMNAAVTSSTAGGTWTPQVTCHIHHN